MNISKIQGGGWPPYF